ncbi:MAG TPA: DUF4870 domain-containing protein [Candidatus Saccharimonadales bacterium]|nr:DUF4870 domain-containing protein [Candidatus Saccharimonadales bacterium]
MAFCKACGQEIGEAGFCPKCGAAQGAGAASAPVVPTGTTDSASGGLEENVAGLLCYLFGWVGGLIFLLIDKRPFVRFHGAQSLALSLLFIPVWIGYLIFSFILTAITAAMHFPIGFLSFFLFPLIGLAFLLTFIFCMYKAYQHEKFKLPLIGNLVEGMLNK